jgi:hypothetical protein
MSANRAPSSTSLCTRSKQGLESRVQGTNTEADAESRHVGFITRCSSHIHSLGQLCASRRARLYLPCCLLTSPHLSSLSLRIIALAFWVDLMSCLPAHLFISAPAHLSPALACYHLSSLPALASPLATMLCHLADHSGVQLHVHCHRSQEDAKVVLANCENLILLCCLLSVVGNHCESWCGRAAGIDGPTWLMATYKTSGGTRGIMPRPQGSKRFCNRGLCHNTALTFLSSLPNTHPHLHSCRVPP